MANETKRATLGAVAKTSAMTSYDLVNAELQWREEKRRLDSCCERETPSDSASHRTWATR